MWLDAMIERDKQRSLSSRAIPADASKVVQMPDGARLVGPTTFSIRAFHGTPHKVDKFTHRTRSARARALRLTGGESI